MNFYRRNILMINIFISRRNYWTQVCSFFFFFFFKIQNRVVFIIKSNKMWLVSPYRIIIKHHAMCWRDRKVSTVRPDTRFSNVYGTTVLALLSHRQVQHMHNVFNYHMVKLITFYKTFMVNITMLWIKPMDMCMLNITSVPCMKIFIINMVLV